MQKDDYAILLEFPLLRRTSQLKPGREGVQTKAWLVAWLALVECSCIPIISLVRD
jgi:hypothetical protein